MRVALLTTFAPSRKEPLAEALQRVHRGFLDASLGEPVVRFNFGDGPPVAASIVDRVLKRHPELERFVTDADPAPGIRGARRISNGPVSRAAGETVPFSLLHTIASGVPRSFPFHSVALHLHSPAFGDLVPTPLHSAQMMAGVLLTDSWWVNGRNRSLSSCVVVEADPGNKKLPPPSPAVAAVLSARGKARRTIQAPLAGATAALSVPTPAVRTPVGLIPSADPKAARAVHAIVLDYRARMGEIVERAALPHDLPAGADAYEAVGPEVTPGPRKPALE